MNPARTALVLVHGAWGGGWIWRRVLAPLRHAGLEVHAPTLCGLGERAHLARPDLGLAAQVTDLLAVIDNEELDEIVLVGHSYGGIVITAAAAALLARERGPRLHHLVYVDAQVPLPGESWSSLHTSATQVDREAQARAHGGFLPPADPAAFGLAGEDRSWLLRRQRPQPFASYREPVHYDAARMATVPRTYLACTQPAFATALAHHERARGWPGWRYVELPTGHCPMVSTPALLAESLRSLI